MMIECKPAMIVAELCYVLPHPLVIRLALGALDISMVSMRIAPTPAHASLRIEVRPALVSLQT